MSPRGNLIGFSLVELKENEIECQCEKKREWEEERKRDGDRKTAKVGGENGEDRRLKEIEKGLRRKINKYREREKNKKET